MRDWMYTSINQIIYVGPFGTTESLATEFVRQQALCACRQMVRYVLGFEAVYLGGGYEPPKAKLRLNTVELQRDILKTRREDIKKDDQLFRDRAGELEDVRRQIEVIDKEWTRRRWKDEINMNLKPLVAGMEWSALNRLGPTDWAKWEMLATNTQRQQMIDVNLIFGKRNPLLGL